MGALKKHDPNHCEKCVPATNKRPATPTSNVDDKAKINSMKELIQKKLKEDPELIKKAAQILTELINK